MKKLLLTIIALLAFSCPVFASNWISIGTTADGSEYSIDISSVSTHNLTQLEENQNRVAERMGYKGANVPYKILWVHIANADGTTSIQHIKVYQDKTMAVLGFANYDSAGNVIHSVPDGYSAPDSIYPGSIGEALYKFAYPFNS